METYDRPEINVTPTRQQVLDRIAAHRDELRSMGVTSLSLFGSLARGEATEGSDVDLLVEFDRPVGLFHLFDVQFRLEEILGVARVDLVMRNALRKGFRDEVLREAIRAA